MEIMRAIKVTVSDSEYKSLQKEAAKQETSLAGVFRLALGLPPLQIGGGRPGAGRPRQKKGRAK